jgi:hypothetical protein
MENHYQTLLNAYHYCVKQSRYPRDDWDEASITLIVHAEALRNNPLAVSLLQRRGA